MKFETKGKLAVISGGSQGLGKSLAKELVKGGASVIIVSRTEATLKETAKELQEIIDSDQSSEDYKQYVKYIAADVSKHEESVRVFDEIGAIPDIVGCFAGTSIPGLFTEMDGSQLDKGVDLGYKTSLHFSHAGLKAMIKADDDERRHLIFCISCVAFYSFIGYGSYAPGKAAIRSLADILRQECMPYNIRVTTVAPGNMDTPGFEQEEKTKPEITRKIEGPSTPLDPDVVAKQVMKDLRRGQQMIYTDLIGWLLSGLQLGTSPRTWAPLQTLIAIVLIVIAPILSWFVERDIKSYFKANPPKRGAK